MSTTIRITLLSGRYGATPWGRSEHEGQVEYPPSPWRLLRAVLHGAFTLIGPSSSPRPLPDGVAELIQRLAEQPPSYHLPFGEFGQIRGFRPAYKCEPVPPLNTKGYTLYNFSGEPKRRSFIDSFLELGAGTAVHVSWPVDLDAEQERLLGACLAGLSYLGRADYPAIWQVVPAMPAANCSPDPAGSLSVLGCGREQVLEGLLMNAQEGRKEGRQSLPGQQWIPYRYNPQRPAVRGDGTIAPAVNRALYAFLADYPMPASAGMAWTDRLHRALLRTAPTSPLFAGVAGGQPLAEDQRAWYSWLQNDGAISALEVWSPQPFSPGEIEAMQHLRRLYGRGGVEVPLRLMRLDYASFGKHQRLRTATPMLLYTTPRPGKPQRSPAAQAIQSLLWGLGEQGKVPAAAFVIEGDSIGLHHPSHGRIAAQVLEVVDGPGITGRGDRKAASGLGFHVELQAEQGLPAIGIGWGRHFGAGRLEAVA
jgi:CRISPR-associated protein Csb2